MPFQIIMLNPTIDKLQNGFSLNCLLAVFLNCTTEGNLNSIKYEKNVYNKECKQTLLPIFFPCLTASLVILVFLYLNKILEN